MTILIRILVMLFEIIFEILLISHTLNDPKLCPIVVSALGKGAGHLWKQHMFQ